MVVAELPNQGSRIWWRGRSWLKGGEPTALVVQFGLLGYDSFLMGFMVVFQFCATGGPTFTDTVPGTGPLNLASTTMLGNLAFSLAM